MRHALCALLSHFRIPTSEFNTLSSQNSALSPYFSAFRILAAAKSHSFGTTTGPTSAFHFPTFPASQLFNFFLFRLPSPVSRYLRSLHAMRHAPCARGIVPPYRTTTGPTSEFKCLCHLTSSCELSAISYELLFLSSVLCHPSSVSRHPRSLHAMPHALCAQLLNFFLLRLPVRAN